MSRLGTAALAGLFLAGCVVSPADWANRACDSRHACFDDRECVDGLCVTPESSDGGHGCVTWSQRRSGFGPSRSGAGASAVIDPSAGNQLTARVPSAQDGSDFSAAAPAQGFLPRTLEGQLTGRLMIPSGSRIDGRAPILGLTGTGGFILELSLEPNWELSAFTGAGVLQPLPVQEPRSSVRLVPGGEYSFRITWRAGAFRRILLDGQTVFDATLSPVTGTGAQPTQLELGILRYDGDGREPLEARFSDWVLCDSADSTF